SADLRSVPTADSCIGRPWAGDARALVRGARPQGQQGENRRKQARGIAQGMLKATCAALAHLSKEYDGQLAAERRQIHRSMLQQPDVMNSIADGDAATAYGLLCNALRFNRGCARRRSKRPSRASGRMTLLRDHLPPLAVAAV